MAYKREWLQTYYTDPLRRLKASLNSSTVQTVTYTGYSSTLNSNSYNQSSGNNRPVIYSQPVQVKTNSSNKCICITCGVCCFLLFNLPTIIAIIITLVQKKK